VQGVGFRFFVLRSAQKLKVTGWARNLEDGRVEVFAQGAEKVMDDFEGRLRIGPPHAEVRTFEVSEESLVRLDGFRVR
jgi:acylphosphatase